MPGVGDIKAGRDYTPTIMVGTAGVACPSCGSAMTRVKDTRVQSDGRRMRYRRCNTCTHKWQTIDANQEVIRGRRLVAMGATLKQCATCKKILPVGDFSKKPNDAHLYRSSCRSCLNIARRKHYYTKELERNYGITFEAYSARLAAQGGKCAICGLEESSKRSQLLKVDHCHKTGKVRGLLCSKCNLGIGNFNDRAESLENAARYLRLTEEGR